MSITFIAISRATLPQGQTRIFGCEHCTPEAELPFGWILDEVTGNSGSDVNYLLSEAARCPKCFGEVTEKTLVDLASVVRSFQ